MENVTRKFAAKYLSISLKGITLSIKNGILRVDKDNKITWDSIQELEKELEERRKIKPPVWIQRVQD